MSSSRNSKRHLKNPNDLIKGVQHLRPRGSYDPLPPPGGYPLPASIRKKFSFAPQIPNLSQISLMPDFTSSSLDLGVRLDHSEVKKISRETPTSLYIHYSLLSLPDTLGVQQPLATPRSSLPRINTATRAQIRSKRPQNRADAVSVVDFGNIQNQQPQIQISQSLRRVLGRESLQTLPISTSHGDLYLGSPSVSSVAESSEPSSPRTFLTSWDKDFSDLTTQIGTDCGSQHPGIDAVECRLVKRLANDTPNLLGTFFIIDLQLPGNPIRVTSQDILPTDLAPDEMLFYDDDVMEIPYKLLTMYEGSQKSQHLPFEGDLVVNDCSKMQPTHRFIGQIDLTNFLEKELEDNEDVWLMIAYEEMDKAGIRRSGGRPITDPAVAAPHVEAEQIPQVIKSLHRDYLVIGFSSAPKPHFSITLLSPTLSSRKEINHPGFLDWTTLDEHLSTPQPFITWVNWQTVRLPDKLYCIPMFGPGLVCWLCFLVDNDLPEIWPSSEKILG